MTNTHQEKINDYHATIERLRKKHRQESERRETERLIERGLLLESFIHGAELFTSEQIYKFLSKTAQTENAIEVLHYIVDPSHFDKPPLGWYEIIEIDEDEDEDESNYFDPNDTELV